MKKLILMMLCAVVFAGSVQAVIRTVSVDCGSGYSNPWYDPPIGDLQDLYVGSAVAPDDGDVWNRTFWHYDAGWAVLFQGVEQGEVVASDGVLTPLEIETGATGIFEYAGSHDMMKDYYYAHGGATSDIVITGLVPESTYDLYLYGNGDSGVQGTIFDFGGVTTGTTGEGEFGGAFVLGQNYVTYTLDSDINGVIAGVYTTNGATDYGILNGLQIRGDILPEPATMCLLGIGALLLRKRR